MGVLERKKPPLLPGAARGTFPVRRSADVLVHVTSSRKAWEACAHCKCVISFFTTAYYLAATVGLSVELTQIRTPLRYRRDSLSGPIQCRYNNLS